MPGVDLAVQVFATNDFGDGMHSDIAEFRTLASTPEAPEAPVFQPQEVTSW
eukprot:CAMPEP_0197637056 /NCGR_PEP_ID=MMETSP1338-20131121/12396_1 /TAXON_ID=43686 ORGANISM="Pelagodinium beii, Strain RCC1491" /NCGR_SAMPLE_ID=MMETSP1338 /ASSEMBLY_ACC=CAM_ASM_000754 /LENGTH=50 /DNA_ID=CAMNT_0043209415 /DNA_START=1 /DNA_END=150 /DNA_ORIENTATION=+